MDFYLTTSASTSVFSDQLGVYNVTVYTQHSAESRVFFQVIHLPST